MIYSDSIYICEHGILSTGLVLWVAPAKPTQTDVNMDFGCASSLFSWKVESLFQHLRFTLLQTSTAVFPSLFFSFLLLCLLHRIHKRALNISKSWCSPFTLFHLIPSQGKPGGGSEQHEITICGKKNPLWTLSINSFLSWATAHWSSFLPYTFGSVFGYKGQKKRTLSMVENCNVNGVLPLFPPQPRQHLYHTFKTSKFQPKRFSLDSKTASFQRIKNNIPLKTTINKPSLK